MRSIITRMAPRATSEQVSFLEESLHGYTERVLRFVANAETRITLLAPGEHYAEASGALSRMNIDVDSWPAPPAGLFVVEERTLYLRSHTAMTVAHEFGHALDCAVGGGVYTSGCDPVIRQAYGTARSFVTPYAASGLDEFYAESVRAYVEVNDDASVWPRATKTRLRNCNPDMFSYYESLFASL